MQSNTKPYMWRLRLLHFSLQFHPCKTERNKAVSSDITRTTSGSYLLFFSFRCSTIRANVYKRQAGIWIRRLLQEWRARQSWEIPRRSNNVLTSVLAQTVIKRASNDITVTEYRPLSTFTAIILPVFSIIWYDIRTVFILNNFQTCIVMFNI